MYISNFIEIFLKNLIRGNEKSKCGVLEVVFGYMGEFQVVPVLYRLRTGSEPVVDQYRFRFSCPAAVPGTGLVPIFTILNKKHITCEINNVIFLITCTKCHKQYVSETCRAIRKRMFEHKASIRKDGQPTPVSHHFRNDGHSHRNMLFSVLEWCTPTFDPSNTAR